MQKYQFRKYVPGQAFNAKLDGPLMSMGASGSIGGILTFGSNKGRNFVRQLVIPSNPRTPAQQGVRSAMRWIGQEWAQLTLANQATWETRAGQTNISPFNAFSSKGMDNWSNGAAPQRQDPAEVVAVTGPPTLPTDVVTERRVTIGWTDPVAATKFGITVYISPTSIFTPGRNNAVALIDVGVLQFISNTLLPGTYFYQLGAFNFAGILSTTFSAEGTFTIV